MRKLFEEVFETFANSLLQKIDGFLAVLSITGGNFSPKSRKLPFSVTSIDVESCLLYYASIDLAGQSSSDKCRGNNLKRGIGDDDSRIEKSCLRIPMKGRIQLVNSFNFFETILVHLVQVFECYSKAHRYSR